ncbi:methyltransferase, FkbM family [Hartmannibacter diazotrophicus]|uniref:Methyltransferase, FkbM family n=1 Tax=Hartmannibacter diazotrophicus TaxID=1482074 RepID=A0A2C9D887_9HYPH|nr:FkbM family methyltransferase [Hartmannibacter diazotrophicus]SON56390.1 methyltransferase, FkbM family [Hartmannibacter diazotrophicus]
MSLRNDAMCQMRELGIQDIMNKCIRKIGQNIKDVFSLGPSFLKYYLSAFSRNGVYKVSIKNFGDMYIRHDNSDIDVIRQVFRYREYDIKRPQFLRRRIEEKYKSIVDSGGTPIIVDAGANIGASSVWFAKTYPEAVIVAIEPDPENAKLLRINTERFPNCKVLEAAIGAESGFVSLIENKLGWAVQTERSETGIKIVTMNDAFEASGADTPFMVKIDIEGFEKDLFQSNLDWLNSIYILIVEPHDWMLPGQLSSSTLQKAIAAHDFELFLVGENIVYVKV